MNALNTSLIQIRRSPYQSLSAILLLTLTFIIGYSLSLFISGSEVILRYFETSPQVIAFFELDAPQSDISILEAEMKNKSYVKDVKVVSKEEALKIYVDENKDDPLLLELVTANILPASIEVSGSDLKQLDQIKKDLEKNKSVDEVILQQEVVESLGSWTRSIRIIGIGSVSVLTVVSLLTMIMVISMKVVTKRAAINIMSIIGASHWFIKAPFIYEGMIYAVVGSTLGWAITMLGFLYSIPWLSEFVGSIPLFPVNPWFFVVQYTSGTLFAIFLGSLAGSIASGRMIKR